jgi:hypothetical protein
MKINQMKNRLILINIFILITFVSVKFFVDASYNWLLIFNLILNILISAYYMYIFIEGTQDLKLTIFGWGRSIKYPRDFKYFSINILIIFLWYIFINLIFSSFD